MHTPADDSLFPLRELPRHWPGMVASGNPSRVADPHRPFLGPPGVMQGDILLVRPCFCPRGQVHFANRCLAPSPRVSRGRMRPDKGGVTVTAPHRQLLLHFWENTPCTQTFLLNCYRTLIPSSTLHPLAPCWGPGPFWLVTREWGPCPWVGQGVCKCPAFHSGPPRSHPRGASDRLENNEWEVLK